MRRAILISFLIFLALLVGAAFSLRADGPDYRNQDLTDRNLSRLDLREAHFEGATLAGTQLVGANLDGAHFDGARIGASRKGPASFSRASLRGTHFTKAQIDAADLQFADLTCTDFSGIDLTNATLDPRPRVDCAAARASNCRTRLEGARLRYEQFPSTKWSCADLTDARFTDLNPNTVSLAGADLSNAVLDGLPLPGFNLRQAKLEGASLNRADLRGAHLEEVTAFGAHLVGARLDFAVLTSARFFASSTARADLSSATFHHATLDGIDLRQAVLRGAVLAGASLRCTGTGSTRRCADLSNATLEGGDGRDAATLITADLSGANLSGAALNGVSFENATLLGAVFDGTTMANTKFTGANLAGASFQKNATLAGVDFYNAGLQNARFVGATLTKAGGSGQGVDFSCAHLGGADFTNTTVQLASFLDAVAPPADLCCEQVGSTRYCGTVQADSSAYGPTILPRLSSVVTCPNGDDAICDPKQWLIPNWQTSDCNPGHETQTVWQKPDCSHDHHETVNVPDAGLLACLQDSFLNGRKEPIRRDLAQTVRRVHCPGRAINDATGLEAFEQLVQLDLSDNALAGAGPIEGLKHLQVLKLADNGLAQLSLSQMKDLIALDVSSNPKLSSITGMVSVYLQSIELAGTGLGDGSKLNLGVQTDLFLADLSRNHFRDLGNLSRLTKLGHLYLDGNQLETLDGIDKLACAAKPLLDFVSLACNPQLTQAKCKSLFGSCKHGSDLLAASGCGRNDLPECRTAPPAASWPACVPQNMQLTRAVYVSALNGKDGSGCGASAASACATVATGIAACRDAGTGCGVLVEQGAYPVGKTLDLASGVSLFGGCFFGPAPSAGGPWYSLLEAAPAAQPAVRASAIQAATAFRGFEVLAAVPAAEGAASIALQTEDSPGLALASVRLVAGDGARGGNGDNGVKGDNGGRGGNVGGRDQGGGGGGTVSACGNTQGGNGAPPTNLHTVKCGQENCNCKFLDCACARTVRSDGSPGGPGDTGRWANGGRRSEGKGYAGCPAFPNPDAGGTGDTGSAGACGSGGNALADLYGSFQGTTWKAPRGNRGGRGGNAGGGGGGGVGGYCVIPCGFDICEKSVLRNGQAGGGGGAGGCGASEGGGGQMGGASLPLIVAGKAPSLDAVVIPATGGEGGRGGDGEVGGGGGGGGVSFSQRVCSVADGATGASGGEGGPGGHGGSSGGGAGGNGGPAIGIAAVAGAKPNLAHVTFYTGRGGKPGGGGTGGRPDGANPCNGDSGKPGNQGTSVEIYVFSASQPHGDSATPDNFPKPPPRPAVTGSTESLQIQSKPDRQ